MTEVTVYKQGRGRDFTYFFAPHNKHSRIYYIFLSKRDLTLLQEAHIGIQTISDHAPISISHFPDIQTRQCSWRLNPTLLTDSTSLQKATEAFHLYFATNSSVELSPLTIWEAHKCVFRGEFISMDAQHKKASECKLVNLASKIACFEAVHKQSTEASIAVELMETRKELRQLLDLKAKRKLFYKKGMCYEHGNKKWKTIGKGPERDYTDF